MTDKQYPPLPKPAYNIRRPTRFRRAGEKTSLTVVFTADQMRAYVDADRAQRLIPVDAPCIEPKDEVEAYRRGVEEYCGVKIFPGPHDSTSPTPSRPDDGNTQE